MGITREIVLMELRSIKRVLDLSLVTTFLVKMCLVRKSKVIVFVDCGIRQQLIGPRGQPLRSLSFGRRSHTLGLVTIDVRLPYA